MAGVPSNSQTLVILHGNRFLEVFTSDRHPVKIIAIPFMESAAGEILTEEHVLQSLPPNWHDTYCEFNLSDRDAIKDTTVVDVAIRQNDIDVLSTLKKHEASK